MRMKIQNLYIYVYIYQNCGQPRQVCSPTCPSADCPSLAAWPAAARLLRVYRLACRPLAQPPATRTLLACPPPARRPATHHPPATCLFSARRPPAPRPHGCRPGGQAASARMAGSRQPAGRQAGMIKSIINS